MRKDSENDRVIGTENPFEDNKGGDNENIVQFDVSAPNMTQANETPWTSGAANVAQLTNDDPMIGPLLLL